MASGSTSKVTKEPKVKWVKSWRDIPSSDTDIQPPTSDWRGAYARKENVIYAVKGKLSIANLEHEKYHAKQRQLHGLQKGEGASSFVAEELEADKYAYDKTGNPKHILWHFGGIADDLMKEELFHVKPSRVVDIIGRQLVKVNPPQGWVEDYKELVARAQKNGQNIRIILSRSFTVMQSLKRVLLLAVLLIQAKLGGYYGIRSLGGMMGSIRTNQ